ncbi:MAG: hypothetical protein Q8R92_13660 [Deltaproteobacteria bacterium]|nr:hypothetical protein [Deltaproteobacteria bacterium]
MASNRPLPGDLTVTGMDQASMYAWMANVTDLVNELQTDHAANKLVVDELATDHATTKATVDAARTAIIELSDDHDTNQTHMTNLKTLVNNMRTYLTGDRLFSGNPALLIDTNFDVKTGGACVVSIDGVLATVAASANADTGTTKTIPAAQWGVFLVTGAANGALTATWAAASAGYANEAAAIAALPAAPASGAPVGYVTVQAHATAGFTAGTDALQTGTGGSISPDTNYYNLADALSTITATVSTSSESALGAADPGAGPATLSNTTGPATLANSTALTLLRS